MWIFLQENWLSDGQLSLLGQFHVNNKPVMYNGVSGFDNQSVLYVRPYGGCAILWRSDIICVLMWSQSVLTVDVSVQLHFQLTPGS